MTTLGWRQGNPLAHRCSLFLFLCALAATRPSLCQAATFTDDFNRPDSATVGNGWSDTAGNPGGNLAISNNELTCLVHTGDGGAGIYRPFPFIAPLTVTATLKEMNGFGGLLRRYATRFYVRNDGTLRHGYGVMIGRSDQNFSNSSVVLFDANTIIEILPSSFQYGPELSVTITFNLDGSVTGTVSEPPPSTNTFNFSFPTRQIQSSGDNFSIDTSCTDTGGTVFPRIDNVVIMSEVTSDPPFLSFPLEVSCGGRPCTAFSAQISAVVDHSVPKGYNCNSRRNCDGVVLAYNGEEGRRTFGANCPPPGYKNESGTEFLIGVVNYVGATCPPPRSEAFRFPRRFLNYDGHSGYDYPYDRVPILAAADGVLEIPASDPINNPSGSSPHKTFNTLRITHPNGYETWYLHARAGSECVAFGTCPNRPASGNTIAVVRGQRIGISGDTGVKGNPHLHFEVRQALDQVVDPYLAQLWR